MSGYPTVLVILHAVEVFRYGHYHEFRTVCNVNVCPIAGDLHPSPRAAKLRYVFMFFMVTTYDVQDMRITMFLCSDRHVYLSYAFAPIPLTSQ